MFCHNLSSAKAFKTVTSSGFQICWMLFTAHLRVMLRRWGRRWMMTGLREPARRPLPTTHSLHIHTHLLRGFNAFYCKKGPSVHTTNPSCFFISFLSLDLGALIFRVGRFVHHVGTDVGTVFVGLSRLEPFTPRMQYDVLPYLSPSDSNYQIDTNQTSPVPEPRTT